MIALTRNEGGFYHLDGDRTPVEPAEAPVDSGEPSFADLLVEIIILKKKITILVNKKAKMSPISNHRT